MSFGTGIAVLSISFFGYYLATDEEDPILDLEMLSHTQLVISTDGVLTELWVDYRAAVDNDLNLMQIDINEVKVRLERHPQIKSATVKRVFPDLLTISIKERVPMFRMKIKTTTGVSKVVLIDEAGTIFENVAFSDKVLRRLPYVAGVNVHMNDEGYYPIETIPVLAELMKVAWQKYPNIARGWSVIYADDLIMAHSFTEGYIRVRSRAVKEVLFAPENFVRQLDRLDYILDNHSVPNVTSISRVNLSLVDQPTVEFANNL